MAHTTDGFWTFGTEPVERPVNPPFRIRLTAANGERIVDSVPDLGKHTILISKHMNYLSMFRPINLKNRPLSCIDIFAICFNFFNVSFICFWQLFILFRVSFLFQSTEL